ncbi:hypothetical protein PEC18_10020 [Paucibacter sp. O1-1]|nr:hypothetical protein [Paucibacter sp. O1-1]MDA3826183.1 hypothetical protein [Paucibacter sp. O1-1]
MEIQKLPVWQQTSEPDRRQIAGRFCWAQWAGMMKASTPSEWDLVKDGILTNYQAIRDQAHIIGEKESHGRCHADSWSSVQFQRMPNVPLAAAKRHYR